MVRSEESSRLNPALGGSWAAGPESDSWTQNVLLLKADEAMDNKEHQ